MKYKIFYKTIKKYILLFIPPIISKLYHKIKNKNFQPPKKNYSRTSSQTIIEKTIPLNESIISKNNVDIIKIESYMEWVNPFREKDFRKYQYKEFFLSIKDKTDIVLDFTNYGLWTICIEYFCGENIVGKEIKTITIEASEYNIGYLAATLPVEIFLTKLWDITTPDSPTIIGLERVLINYNALPQNVFPFPLASREELYTPYKGFNNYAQRLVSYVGCLHRLNPNARFNIYLCDHKAFYSLALMYANGIPEKNFNVFLLSDGTGTYRGFNNIFNCPDADIIYNMMQTTWCLSKQKAIESGVQKWKKETFITCGNPSVSLEKRIKGNITDLSNRTAYAFIMAKENSNYKWILHNPQLLKYANNCLAPLSASICKINFVNDIKQLENHKEELIRMLDMDYSFFEKSYKSNKRICLLLTSYPPSSDDDKFIDKTMSYYGKNYDYYVKEHPWAPKDDKRVQKFINKGILILNSKIPTEIYMMLDSKINIAGYLSSVFLSIGLLENPTSQILSIWGVKDCKIKTECLDFRAKTAMNLESDKVVIYE